METEILRGAKVRITTVAAQVGNNLTPIVDIQETALAEADHGIRLLPMVFFIAGPLAASAIQIFTGGFLLAMIVCLAIMAIGGMLLRDRWMHQVNARLKTGRSITLYRTQNIGDAKLFHAALQKALELREQDQRGSAPAST